jgi:hypothetical protein
MNRKMKVSKKQIMAYMSARHPNARFKKSADSWVIPGSGYGLSSNEAAQEAQAEIDLANSGIIKMPEWAKTI